VTGGWRDRALADHHETGLVLRVVLDARRQYLQPVDLGCTRVPDGRRGRVGGLCDACGGLSVAGDSNLVRDNTVSGGGDELCGEALSLFGDSNIVESNRVRVSRMSWHFPFTLRGNHNFLRDNHASNHTSEFDPECPTDPGNQVFCDYGTDTVYAGGNLLPDPR
jgi:hypothetical protein